MPNTPAGVDAELAAAGAVALANGGQQGAKIRARSERAIVMLKTWKLPIKPCCCPRRATAIVQAILVLHGVEINRYAG